MNPAYTNGTDRWLTPPDLLVKLGEFDFDPCCEPWMPWRTAKRMLSLAPHSERLGKDGKVEVASIVPGSPGFTEAFVPTEIVADGLLESWEGRVFLNHPYSSGLRWAEKMVVHGNGIALTAAKSMDTEWSQLMLSQCDALLLMSGRLLFHYVDGTKSTGKWLPNALWAFGEENGLLLRELWRTGEIPGMCLRQYL